MGSQVENLRVKIIASLGPASSDPETIVGLANAGASGFRINFTHGDEKIWKVMVEGVRSAEEKLSTPMTLIGDLQGASIRLGFVEKPIILSRGDSAKLILSEEGNPDKKLIPLPNKKVFQELEIGDVILMDDGRVRLKVTEVSDDTAEIVALTDAVIKSRKGIVLMNKEIDFPPLTDKDIKDVEFACREDFDYIGLSYVRRESDVLLIKKYLNELGCNVGIIAKIETRSAIYNLDRIIENSDAVLVARGDLGMNYGLEQVPYLQELIVEHSLRAGKPVIVATQLLESMIEKPVPTRAEVVDVNAAVNEGVDALMLTGETAVGKYPIEAVRWLKKIVEYSERKGRIKVYREGGPMKRRFAKGVTELAEDLGAKLIIYSKYGRTAKFIASLRPSVDAYVGVPSNKVMRLINILWGVKPILVQADSYDEGLEKTFALLFRDGYVKLGDLVILSYGMTGDEQVIKVRRVRPKTYTGNR
jgi:pyruvate kinase